MPKLIQTVESWFGVSIGVWSGEVVGWEAREERCEVDEERWKSEVVGREEAMAPTAVHTPIPQAEAVDLVTAREEEEEAVRTAPSGCQSRSTTPGGRMHHTH